MMGYDSRPDTYEHIASVRGNLLEIATDLIARADVHDASKLLEPELSMFNEFTPKLREMPYSTDPDSEYKRTLALMHERGLAHHYAVNDHHPEHFAEGIGRMDLMQLTEMLADWRAAVERQPNGSLKASIENNAGRFGYGDELKNLLINTAHNLGWL